MSATITGGVANQPDAPEVKFGFGRNDGWFEAEIVEDDERVIDTPSISEVTEHDLVFEEAQTGNFAQNWLVDLTVYPRPNDDGTTPTITITNNGGVRKGSGNKLETEDGGDGIAETVTVATSQRTMQFSVTGSIRATGPAAKIFKRFADGTLAAHCEDAVNSRIAGATTDMLPIFTGYTASNSSGDYTRTPDSWVYDLGQALTCISPWNDNAGNRKAGTAITPRHVGLAAHFEYPVNTVLRFVTADNQTVTRTVIGKKRHPEYVPHFPDVTIYLLDSDLPPSIQPCKVLPSNWSDYLPNGPKWIAALCLDQEEKALVTDLRAFLEGRASFQLPNKTDEEVLYEDKIAGDSGNPAFLIINGELVCLTFWTGGGAGNGTFLTSEILDMNQMIADLDAAEGINTGYTIQTVDLSGFPTFNS